MEFSKIAQSGHTGWELVVAELAERLLPIPEVRGSNPANGKILQFTVNC